MKRNRPIRRKVPLRQKRPSPRVKKSEVLAHKRPSQMRLVPKFLCDDGVYRFPDGREVCNTKSEKGREEYKNRREKMLTRQSGVCALQIHPFCVQKGGRLTAADAEFDHEDGRTSGKQDDRIEVTVDGVTAWKNAAVCHWCNTEKGSRRVPYIYTPE